MSDKNVSPHFEPGMKGHKFNVLRSNPNLVAYNRRALLAINTMTLRRGFYEIPG